MDSASDFGSGGWGFESPQGLCGMTIFGFFLALHLSVWAPYTRLACGCKFGRVVKALALGASLARGMGSNPIACTRLFVTVSRRSHVHSVTGV
jgi:hypothetical protein